MSEQHKPYCAAHGCPLLGTMSASTTGGADFWCHIHFGREVGELQPLTVEINRREWLAKIITNIRMHYGSDKWGEVYRAAQHEMAMRQRSDLHFGKVEKETAVWQWIARLQGELEAMVTGVLNRPRRQVPLLSKEQPDAGPQRVQFPVPEPA